VLGEKIVEIIIAATLSADKSSVTRSGLRMFDTLFPFGVDF
jgi:hypothetical protein